jgi:hypothetical protein
VFTLRLRDLLALIAVIAILLGFGRWAYLEIAREFRRVHRSEEHIAEHVRGLGGSCTASKANNRHIVAVSFANTLATDEDVRIVMRLQYLISLDVSNTAVSDASLPEIVAHKTMKEIRVSGSQISKKALHKALSSTDSHLFVIE